MTRLFQPILDPATYRALLFYAAELGLAAVGFTLIVAGWPVILIFSITPLVVPLLIGLRAAVGGLAYAEAAAARSLLGVRTRPPVTTSASGFW
jgi:hypothetical protein